MNGIVAIHIVGRGWLRFVPVRWRKPVARKALRAIMEARGLSVRDYSDHALDNGIRAFGDALHVRPAPIEAAPNLRDFIIEADAARRAGGTDG